VSVNATMMLTYRSRRPGRCWCLRGAWGGWWGPRTCAAPAATRTPPPCVCWCVGVWGWLVWESVREADRNKMETSTCVCWGCGGVGGWMVWWLVWRSVREANQHKAEDGNVPCPCHTPINPPTNQPTNPHTPRPQKKNTTVAQHQQQKPSAKGPKAENQERHPIPSIPCRGRWGGRS
jgi:hypothetical protein